MTFEREFLKLAAVWLECRWCVFGGDITDESGVVIHRGANRFTDLSWHLLGMFDYEMELRLICWGSL